MFFLFVDTYTIKMSDDSSDSSSSGLGDDPIGVNDRGGLGFSSDSSGSSDNEFGFEESFTEAKTKVEPEIAETKSTSVQNQQYDEALELSSSTMLTTNTMNSPKRNKNSIGMEGKNDTGGIIRNQHFDEALELSSSTMATNATGMRMSSLGEGKEHISSSDDEHSSGSSLSGGDKSSKGGNRKIKNNKYDEAASLDGSMSESMMSVETPLGSREKNNSNISTKGGSNNFRVKSGQLDNKLKMSAGLSKKEKRQGVNVRFHHEF